MKEVSHVLEGPSHTTVVAYLSLFLVLTGGTAFALSGSNTVFSDDITDGEVKRPDVRADAVAGNKVANDSLTGADVTSLTGGDVSDNSLTGNDVNEPTLGKVPSAGDADALGGRSAGDFMASSLYTKQEGAAGEEGTDSTNPGAAGSEASEAVSCDPGDRAISGGYQLGSNDGRVRSSYRTRAGLDTWVVVWDNASNPANVLVMVTCIDQE